MSNTIDRFWQGICGASVMAFALVTPFLRQQRTSWGGKDSELYSKLPGDDIISHPKWQYTQGISINTTTDKVWPWLVQIGQGKGGFYSYEMLENLVGCKIHNTEKIIPEYQKLKPGDNIMLHPKVPYPVAEVREGNTIVLHYDSRTGQKQVSGTKPSNYFESTWLFLVTKQGNQSSRLISRFRIDYNLSTQNRIAYGYFVEPVSTTMQKQMLKGIRKRAEVFKNSPV